MFAAAQLAALVLLLTVGDEMKYALIEGIRDGLPLATIIIDGLLRHLPMIGVFGTLLGVLVAVLLRAEIRYAALSRALTETNHWPFRVILGSGLIWISQAFLYPGYLLGGDTTSHIVRAVHFGMTLANGEIPIWDNDFYLGVPLGQFYAPLFIWLTGTLFSLWPDASWTPKIVLLAANLGGAIGLFYWLRSCSVGGFGALVGAFVYIGSWGHGHLLLYQGVLPTALVMAFLPFTLWSIERIISHKTVSRRDLGLLALFVALLMLSHQAHGFVGGLYLTIYTVLRWAIFRRGFATLGLIALAAGLGLVTSISVVLPFLAETDWVVASAGAELPRLVLPDLQYLGWLLTWGASRTTFGADSAAYLGYSALALAIAAVGVSSTKACRPHRSLIMVFLALFLLSLILRGLLARDIVFTVLFLAPLAAMGAECLAQRWSRHAPALILTLLMLDLGIIAIQPLARTDKGYLEAAAQAITERYPNSRVLLASVGDSGEVSMDAGPSGSVIAMGAVATLGGPHNHGATPVHNYLVAAAMLAQRDLQQPRRLGQDAQRLLAMFNVAAIIADDQRGMGLPANIPGTRALDHLGPVLSIADAAPIVFSTRLATLHDRDFPDRPMLWANEARCDAVQTFASEVLSRMHYEPEQRRAGTLLVRDALPTASAEGEGEGDVDVSFALRDYRVEDQLITLTLSSTAPGWVQIAHPWYPAFRVLHNGQEVRPLQSPFSLIVLPVSTGDNHYVIEPVLSTLRVVNNGITLFGFAIIGLLLLLPERRSNPSMSGAPARRG